MRQRKGNLDPVRSHQNFQADDKTRIVYTSPLFECGTASYADAKRILHATCCGLVIANELDARIVPGDDNTCKVIFERSQVGAGHRHVRVSDPEAR